MYKLIFLAKYFSIICQTLLMCDFHIFKAYTEDSTTIAIFLFYTSSRNKMSLNFEHNFLSKQVWRKLILLSKYFSMLNAVDVHFHIFKACIQDSTTLPMLSRSKMPPNFEQFYVQFLKIVAVLCHNTLQCKNV